MPVEIGQGFEAAEAGLEEPTFQTVAGLLRDFGAGDFFQELMRRPTLGRGAGQQIVQAVGGEG